MKYFFLVSIILIFGCSQKKPIDKIEKEKSILPEKNLLLKSNLIHIRFNTENPKEIYIKDTLETANEIKELADFIPDDTLTEKIIYVEPSEIKNFIPSTSSGAIVCYKGGEFIGSIDFGIDSTNTNIYVGNDRKKRLTDKGNKYFRKVYQKQ